MDQADATGDEHCYHLGSREIEQRNAIFESQNLHLRRILRQCQSTLQALSDPTLPHDPYLRKDAEDLCRKVEAFLNNQPSPLEGE